MPDTPNEVQPETPPSPESQPKKTSYGKVKGLRTNRLVNGSDQEKKNYSLAKVPTIPKPDRGGLPRAEAAIERLNISKTDLAKAPPLSSLLKEISRGRAMALQAMRFSEQPLIKEFLAAYDEIPEGDRKCLPLEAIALKARVNVQHLFGEILLAMREHSVNAVKFIAVASHPRVMKKRVEFAQTEGGAKDRDAIDIMLGALPTSKPGSTFINKFYAAGKDPDEPEKPEPAPVIEELVEDANFVFPNAEDIQDRMQAVRQKQLVGK